MTDQSEAPILKTKQRSSSYPSFTIFECIEFVRAIYVKLGISSYQTRETIAKVLNASPDTLNKKLSAAVKYGLLDLKPKEGYKATTDFITIYKPLSDEERKKILIKCLLKPTLYTQLINQYNNNIVPSVVAIGTNLYRNHNIMDNASEKAAQVFFDNLKDLELMDADNHLNIDLNEEGLTPDNEENPDELKMDLMPTALKSTNYNTQTITGISRIIGTSGAGNPPVAATQNLPMVISFKDNRKAQIIYPQDMTNEEWEKVIRVIEAMKD